MNRFGRYASRVLVAIALLAGWASQGYAQGKPFVTRWHAEKGTSIKLPIKGTNYRLVWKKANGEIIESKSATSDYEKPQLFQAPETGDYIAEVGPEGVEFIRNDYSFFDSKYLYATPEKLMEVVRWGDVAWTSMKDAFHGCESMELGPEVGVPNLSKVTDMSGMFVQCRKLNQSLQAWDVSKVTNMGLMFYDCYLFNQPLAAWNVSSVEDMTAMFDGCHSFNQPLSGWDVSKVKTMSSMFSNCHEFNQPLEQWDVRSVENMVMMLYNCRSFNQPLEGWDVSRVKRLGGLLDGCLSFDHPLGRWKIRVVKVNSAIPRVGIGRSGMSPANYAATLAGWAADADIATGVTLEAEELYYDKDDPNRKKLIDEKQWKIEKDTTVPYILLGPETVIVGQKVQMSVKFFDFVSKEQQKTLTWSTPDPSVAKVDEHGLVTGVRKGLSTVYAKWGKLHRHLHFKVLDSEIPVTSVTVTPTAMNMMVGDSPVVLGLSVKPYDATNKEITWSTEPQGIVSVDAQGKVTPIKAGAAQVIAKAHNGKQGVCQVTVKEPATPAPQPNPSPNPGTDPNTDVTSLLAVTVSPNPFRDVITVHHASDVRHYALFNASGAVVMSGSNGAETLTIGTSDLPQGTYILQLRGQSEVRSIRLVK